MKAAKMETKKDFLNLMVYTPKKEFVTLLYENNFNKVKKQKFRSSKFWKMKAC